MILHDPIQNHRDLTIRPVQVGDLPGLMMLLNGDRKSGPSALSFPSLPETIRQKFEGSDQSGFRLVALIDDDLVAQASLNLSSRVGRLTLMVRDDHRQRGIGSALLARIIMAAEGELALTRIELEVFSDNMPAIALYRKFGFEIEVENDGTDGRRFLSMARPVLFLVP
jgi:putative acetyltransferase